MADQGARAGSIVKRLVALAVLAVPFAAIVWVAVVTGAWWWLGQSMAITALGFVGLVVVFAVAYAVIEVYEWAWEVVTNGR